MFPTDLRHTNNTPYRPLVTICKAGVQNDMFQYLELPVRVMTQRKIFVL